MLISKASSNKKSKNRIPASTPSTPSTPPEIKSHMLNLHPISINNSWNFQFQSFNLNENVAKEQYGKFNQSQHASLLISQSSPSWHNTLMRAQRKYIFGKFPTFNQFHSARLNWMTLMFVNFLEHRMEMWEVRASHIHRNDHFSLSFSWR